MKAEHLMIVGASVGVLLLIGGAISSDFSNPVVLWAAGMVFGKGYGIWEQRTGGQPQ